MKTFPLLLAGLLIGVTGANNHLHTAQLSRDTIPGPDSYSVPGPVITDTTDEVDLAAFMERFPPLQKPFAILKPYDLRGIRDISDLNWTKKTGLDKYKPLGAVGMVKDCGDSKVLLLVQIPRNSTIYIFHVIAIKDGKIVKEATPEEGTISRYDDAFWNQNSVKINFHGTITITTSMGKTNYKTTIEPCD